MGYSLQLSESLFPHESNEHSNADISASEDKMKHILKFLTHLMMLENREARKYVPEELYIKASVCDWGGGRCNSVMIKNVGKCFLLFLIKVILVYNIEVLGVRHHNSTSIFTIVC